MTIKLSEIPNEELVHDLLESVVDQVRSEILNGIEPDPALDHRAKVNASIVEKIKAELVRRKDKGILFERRIVLGRFSK